jgi:hypothetical protein
MIGHRGKCRRRRFAPSRRRATAARMVDEPWTDSVGGTERSFCWESDQDYLLLLLTQLLLLTFAVHGLEIDFLDNGKKVPGLHQR